MSALRLYEIEPEPEIGAFEQFYQVPCYYNVEVRIINYCRKGNEVVADELWQWEFFYQNPAIIQNESYLYADKTEARERHLSLVEPIRRDVKMKETVYEEFALTGRPEDKLIHAEEVTAEINSNSFISPDLYLVPPLMPMTHPRFWARYDLNAVSLVALGTLHLCYALGKREKNLMRLKRTNRRIQRAAQRFNSLFKDAP